MEELKARGQGGGVIGSFPLAKIKVSLLAAEVNESTNEMAVSIAAGDAFEKALRDANPTLFEPIMKLTITTPDEFYGEFLSDLAQRRARVVHTENHAGSTVIEAHAPLAELFGYSNAMRSLSQGRAEQFNGAARIRSGPGRSCRWIWRLEAIRILILFPHPGFRGEGRVRGDSFGLAAQSKGSATVLVLVNRRRDIKYSNCVICQFGWAGNGFF